MATEAVVYLVSKMIIQLNHNILHQIWPEGGVTLSKDTLLDAEIRGDLDSTYIVSHPVPKLGKRWRGGLN